MLRSAASIVVALLWCSNALAQFGEPVRVCTNSTDSVYPHLAVDRAGNIAVLWSDGDPRGMFFARSTDAGASFSTPQRISSEGQFSDLAVDSLGVLYVAWKDWSSRLMFTRSTDGGTTFGEPRSIGSCDSWPELVVDGTNRLHVVWTSNWRTYSHSEDSGESVRILDRAPIRRREPQWFAAREPCPWPSEATIS